MKTLLVTLLLVILVCPFVFGDWGYSQVDDLVLEFNDKNNEDTILYTNIKESLSDKPRKINDTQCVAQFRRVLESVDNRENWALKVVDSWGKLPGSGLFWGRLVDLGNYDECISTAHDLGGDDNVFVGQYCIASYPLEVVLHRQPAHQKNALSEKPQPSFYQRGVCVPDACSIEALNAIFQKMIRMNTNANITISMFRENECSRNEVLEFDTADICAIIFFGILGILVATSTTYDIFAGYLNRKKNPICIAFSMITNAEKLFKIRIHDQSSGTIECLNGLRFISIVWIIYCHIFTMMPNVPVMNYKYLWEWLAEIYPLFIVSGPFAVDTFFVLSGFLLAHHVFREMDKRGGLSIPTILKMYFHRYVRLFPVLGATILFTSTIFKYLGDGPYWKKVGLKAGLYCNEYWWSSLLYIQNFVNPDKICLIHTWYLSVDTQLYILSPLILIPLFKWGRKFVTIMILMIVASSGFIFAITMIHDINIHPLEALISSKTAYKTLIYCNIHTRSPPWLMGILLAYYMHNRKGSKNTLSTFRTIGGWLSCMTLFAIIVFAPYQAQQALDEPNFLVNAFYSSSTRILWSLAIIWIIFACCQGDGGLVNSFLSYPFWQVFGRLTYTLYIVHPMMIFWLAGTERVTVFFSHLVSIQWFWARIGLTVTASIFIVLVIESPITAIEKTLLRKERSQSESQSGRILSLHLDENKSESRS